jgi:hypothetical protein
MTMSFLKGALAGLSGFGVVIFSINVAWVFGIALADGAGVLAALADPRLDVQPLLLALGLLAAALWKWPGRQTGA